MYRSPFAIVRSTCTWFAASILALLPMVVAADYGGVLRWTHYLVALAALLAVILATCALTEPDGRHLRQHLLLVPLILWLGFALFQTIPLPHAAVGFLSPGSAEAYTEWIKPFFTEKEQLSAFSISLSRHDSRHVCAMLAILIGIAWASATLFHQRPKIVLLLGAISVGASLHAGIGLWRLVFPETDAWSVATNTSATAFGAFINRNNAALFLNLGLGASLGLLAWRLTALSGLEVDDPSFELNDLLSLSSDRDSFVGLIGAVLCIAGLLVCGSRGGLVAACLGLLLAFGWIRQRRGFGSIPVVGTVIAVCLALLLVPLSLDLESIRRLDVVRQHDASTFLRDGRLLHWRDSLNTAAAHLPMGSGFSTYAYAYLPHQQFSPNAWFQHADNLWLELLTEQGVMGVALALSILVITMMALQRLGESPDPIDHGLRIAGWYCLAAIVVSQMFDFGLIILGNLLVVAILIPAIVSRAASVTIATTSGNTGLFASHRRRAYGGALAFVSIGLMCIALPKLRKDAAVESLTRFVDLSMKESNVDTETLDVLSAQLQRLADRDASPRVLETLAGLEYLRARFAETLASAPEDAQQLEQRFRKTGPAVKRLTWLREGLGGAGESPEARPVSIEGSGEHSDYVLPFELAKQSLRELPLDPAPRARIVYLDFVHRDLAMTSSALRQLRQLHRCDPKMLVRIGQYAADSGEHVLSAELWREALIKDPNLTSQTLALADQYAEVKVEEILPLTTAHLSQAAAQLLKDVAKNRGMLEVALGRLDCESCDTMIARSECEERTGDIAYSLARYDEAFAEYREAISFAPTDANLRIKLITRLRDHGDRRQAAREARLARLAIKDDDRFTQLIESMAKHDLEELTRSD